MFTFDHYVLLMCIFILFSSLEANIQGYHRTNTHVSPAFVSLLPLYLPRHLRTISPLPPTPTPPPFLLVHHTSTICYRLSFPATLVGVFVVGCLVLALLGVLAAIWLLNHAKNFTQDRECSRKDAEVRPYS